MTQSVKSLEASARSGRKPSPGMPSHFDGVIPDSRQLSAQGARPAVAMLVFPNSRRGSPAASLVQRPSQRELRAATAPGPLANGATMNGKFESHSNNHNESNVNRPLRLMGSSAARQYRRDAENVTKACKTDQAGKRRINSRVMAK